MVFIHNAPPLKKKFTLTHLKILFGYGPVSLSNIIFEYSLTQTFFPKRGRNSACDLPYTLFRIRLARSQNITSRTALKHEYYTDST